MNKIKIIECPRDAMQGWQNFIPTADKVRYLEQLMKVGFDTIDFGSFVSHKAIPQMGDTARVLMAISKKQMGSKLLAIVVNLRGAEEAMAFDEVAYLGYPFSVSPTFQKLNAHSTIEESFDIVKNIHQLCIRHNKKLVVYLSMAFGNPYGDAYSEKNVLETAAQMAKDGIEIISLADTVGLASPDEIGHIVKECVGSFPEHEIGVHLHSTSANWQEKLDAALDNGCYRFDGAIKGFGGCPMSGSDLVGNMDTGNMIRYFQQKGLPIDIDETELRKAEKMATEIFV